jgi:hypothetical protein
MKIKFKNGNSMEVGSLPDDEKAQAFTAPGKYFPLENINLICIPTDSDELAQLIADNSYDWSVVLDFLCEYSEKRGIMIRKQEVAEKILDLLGVGIGY